MNIKPIVTLYPHQHKYVMSDYPHPAIVGGYGSGKTFANIYRVLHLLEKRDNAFIFYCAPTYDLINTTFYPEFIERLELYGIEYEENKQQRLIIITNNKLKGKIKLISLDNYKYLVGFNATDGILDEFDVIPHTRQEAIWTRALARLRGCEDASLSITTTPEGYKYTYQLHTEGKIRQINASTDDNKSLPKSFISELLSNYDDQHKAMYFSGKYVNLAGLLAIYQFRRENLAPPIVPDIVPTNITVGMDFNVDPFCLTVSAMIDGCKVTFDEMYIRNTGGAGGYESYTDKACNLLLQRYPNAYYKKHIDSSVEKVYNIVVRPDMTAGARKTSAGMTDIAILRKYGLNIEGQRNPFVSERIKIANIAMSQGLWKITKNCRELVKDLEFVITDKYGELDKSNPMRGHMLDAATYDTYREFYYLYRQPTKTKAKAV